ncbi:MAG: alpha/beta fold hydrolase [Promethearchaeota archaeon]|nr:MAG: alpha/beta fold hydrolase [Candidatus Lokiarchaeota archaeon]
MGNNNTIITNIIRVHCSMDNLSHDDIKFFKRIILLIILLAISLTYLHVNKLQSYSRYERIQFTSSGSYLYANLYYPTKEIDFQESRPLLIYCHGIGSQRDFDLRIPIEFTKRGFYVASLDYHGHGESGGTVIDINPITKRPAVAQACSDLLDTLEVLPFYSAVNVSQIGLIGHSMGGMVVLMNQALDPRFNITVAWAPLVNFEPEQLGIIQTEYYNDYIPVNLINASNTNNLLIIMHVHDEMLNFTENAIKAQELTNCTLIPITTPLIGGGHQLFTNLVLIESIQWFEGHFFGSEIINGPIYITFIINYVVLLICMFLLFMIVLLLTSYTSQFFTYEDENAEHQTSQKQLKFPRIRKTYKIAKIIIYTAMFLLNWQIFERLFGLVGILYSSLNITVVYLLIKAINYYNKLKSDQVKFGFTQFKDLLKSQFRLKHVIFALFATFYFIGIYIIFTYSYPFAFMWPSNFIQIVIAELIFPIYFSIEIFYRKIIYPQLSFLKTERRKSLWTIAISLFIQTFLISLTSSWLFFPSVLFTYAIFTVVIIQNTLIYENTKSFSLTILSSFNIIQLFFATVISNVLGISTVLNTLLNI